MNASQTQAGQATTHVSTLLVKDLMTTRVLTIRMDETVETAKAMFDDKRFHHLVVMDKVAVVGVVSDRDILKVLSPFIGGNMEQPRDRTTLERHIHQIMTRTLVTIDPNETARAAAQKMQRERVSCLPVVDEKMSLLGLVTIRDFLRLAARQP